jgi:hypothetical protein
LNYSQFAWHKNARARQTVTSPQAGRVQACCGTDASVARFRAPPNARSEGHRSQSISRRHGRTHVRRADGPAISVENVGAAGIWNVVVDPNQFENPLLNLCINARHAMPVGAELVLETANRWLDDRASQERPAVRTVRLVVRDGYRQRHAAGGHRATLTPFSSPSPLARLPALGYR